MSAPPSIARVIEWLDGGAIDREGMSSEKLAAEALRILRRVQEQRKEARKAGGFYEGWETCLGCRRDRT